ncbi:oligosaccharide flippase family protein [Aeromonas media]|uniref:oligosaccharide flippase family protein n=1 Tax=Aeromonas media TaxID=651 RepID=UPI0013A6F474|nr:oligosaccharide flippase family protein [Aeromonas media]
MSKKLYSNIVALIFVQLSNYLAPLLVLPYLSRVLGVDGFGVIAIALSACAIALIATDFGFNLSATYWIAQNRDDEVCISQYIGAIFFIKVVLCFIFLMLLWGYSEISHGNLLSKHYLIPWIGFVVVSQTFQATWFFQGIEKMNNVTFFTVTAKLSYLLLVFCFVDTVGDERWVLICLAISNVFASFFSMFLIYKEGYAVKFSGYSYAWRVFKDSAPFFLSRAAVSVYTSASTFIIGSISGAHQAAIYSSSEKLYQAGQGVTSPITQSLFPYITRSKDIATFYRVVFLSAIPMTIGCIVCYLYAGDILGMFYGADFVSSTKVLQVFMICLVVNYISVNFGYPAFSSIGRVDVANKTVMLASLIQFLSLSVLFYLNDISAYNVAISVLIVECIVMFLRVSLFIHMRHQLNMVE